ARVGALARWGARPNRWPRRPVAVRRSSSARRARRRAVVLEEHRRGLLGQPRHLEPPLERARELLALGRAERRETRREPLLRRRLGVAHGRPSSRRELEPRLS